MNIAIDFDGTYTTDPELWDEIVDRLLARGHSVWCVTSRIANQKNRREVVIPNVTTIFCGMAAKIWHMETNVGIKIDIWIDDDPAMCAFGKDDPRPPIVQRVQVWTTRNRNRRPR